MASRTYISRIAYAAPGPDKPFAAALPSDGVGRWWSIAAAVAGSLAAPACGASVFECLSADGCAGQDGGTCEASGYCSFPDDTCASGRRYGEYAPAAFSKVCVEPDAGTGTSAASATTGSASASASEGTDGTTGVTGPESRSSSDASSGPSATAALTLSTTTSPDSFGSTGESDSSPTEGTASTSGELWPQTVLVPASVAACTDPVANDPAACELSTDTQGMSVDAMNDGAMGAATTAFVAFDLETLQDLPPGAVLTSAELRLTTTDEPNAESQDQTGEIWRTSPFTEMSLLMGQPELTGDMPLAPDQGGAASSQLVTWVIPNAELDGIDTLYLAVVATTAQGVDYWNALGMEPPVLALEFADGG